MAYEHHAATPYGCSCSVCDGRGRRRARLNTLILVSHFACGVMSEWCRGDVGVHFVTSRSIIDKSSFGDIKYMWNRKEKALVWIRPPDICVHAARFRSRAHLRVNGDLWCGFYNIFFFGSLIEEKSAPIEFYHARIKWNISHKFWKKGCEKIGIWALLIRICK